MKKILLVTFIIAVAISFLPSYAVAGTIMLASQQETTEGLSQLWYFEGFTVTTNEERNIYLFNFVDNATGKKNFFVVGPPLGVPPIDKSVRPDYLVNGRLVRILWQGQIKYQVLYLSLHSQNELKVVSMADLMHLIAVSEENQKKNIASSP